jgi:chromosome segregation ATPase
MSLQLTSRGDFDTRMEREVGRLRDDAQRERDALREAARDVADRENRVLREAKASLETECDRLRHRVDQLSAELSVLLKEHTGAMGERTKEVSELRADLKMKIFELTALGTSFEVRGG